MPDIKQLSPDEWGVLRDIRLSALRESPHAFLSTYELEKRFDEYRWRAEFTRGNWHVGIVGGSRAGLVGATREPGAPVDECYLEYIWVSPEYRRGGVALSMLETVLGQLRDLGVRTAFLWVLDGNEAAVRLYHRAGFTSSNHRQPLAEHPGRTEERMQLRLA
jgi:ribosomal protein S18 acetylase RimI-like enzyme